jgi:hypothetical protein
MVGGTHFLWAMAGLGEALPEYLETQAAAWFTKMAGQPQKYLPLCPGTAGIARLWLCSLLREREIAVEPLPGVGHKEPAVEKPG